MGRYKIIRVWHGLEKVEQNFYDASRHTLTLIDPKLTLTLNKNDVLEFTMPITHKYFSTISPMIDEFLVLDDIRDSVLFIGRPVSVRITSFKTAHVYCEGASGYLNDILVRPEIWESTTPSKYFGDLISRYNTIKTKHIPHQEITLGDCTIPDRKIYRTCDYETVRDAISRGCVETDGGYLKMDYYKNGEKKINWYAVPPQPDIGRQKITYGKNIVSYEEEYDLSGRATVILPVGAEQETESAGETVTTRVVGDIYPYSISGNNLNEVVKEYGYVEELKTYDEAETKSAILAAIKQDRTIDEMSLEREGTIECEAVDLYFLKNSINPFFLGQIVDLVDVPSPIYNKLNDALFVKQIEYNLESAIVQILVGSRDKASLSDEFKKTNDRASRASGTKGARSGNNKGNGLYMYIGDVEYLENT